MSSRIELFDPSRMSQDQREIYETIVSGPRGRLVGPLRAVMLVPDLAKLWSKFGEYLRYSTIIRPPSKELAILVTARRWNSQVEWEVHARDAQAAGLAKGIVKAVAAGEAPVFEDPADFEVYEFTRQLLQQGDVLPESHLAVVTRWGVRGVIELTAVVGYYSMVSLMLNAQGIPTTTGDPALFPLTAEDGLSAIPKASLVTSDAP